MTAPVSPSLFSYRPSGFPKWLSGYSETILSSLTLALVGAATIAGWSDREDSALQPDHGWGYALGIVGAALMVVLLIYPLRKRFAALRWIGSVAAWFRLHMLLGLLGPLAILYHARFSYSATNSGVALFSMLGVVVSGLFGWFLYKHMFRGFSERRIEASDLLADVIESRAALDADGDAGERVRRQLELLASVATSARPGILNGFLSVLRLSFRTRRMSFGLKSEIRQQFARNAALAHWPPGELRRHQEDAAYHLSIYLRAVRETSGFALYDRLFRLWHFLHLPLYFFLVITVIIHVTAVHMY